MKIFYLRNFRNGLATNSSSTHSVIYQNMDSLLSDLNIFQLDYYDRCDATIAASRHAKIKYVLANIWHNQTLVEHMVLRFPEMKHFFPLIKKQVENENSGNAYLDPVFGMTCRGPLYTRNLEFDIQYLTDVIENPNIVIVGGSDELNFFYDTTEGHKKVFDVDDLCNFNGGYVPSKEHKSAITKNGNYWVAYGRTPVGNRGRIRLSTSNQGLIPQYPELIDLRITNACEHACPFCFMDSKRASKHMDPNYIHNVLASLPIKTEFSIGGGNILLHPNLEDILKKIKKRDHIINVTINYKDCETILSDVKLKDMFTNYVDGIGISIFDTDGVDVISNFENVFEDKYITAHIIPEYIGLEKAIQIRKYMWNRRIWFPILFLGYKENGRGSNCNYQKFTKEDLDLLIKKYDGTLAIDTSFADTYKEWLSDHFEVDKCITWNEGEFSMYVDGVNELIYKSSYQLDKPYWISEYKIDPPADTTVKKSLIEIFNSIRKDGGLKIFDEIPKYWDESL